MKIRRRPEIFDGAVPDPPFKRLFPVHGQAVCGIKQLKARTAV
jgi:hypothetical protein